MNAPKVSAAEKNFRTALGKVRGHGSARAGTGHFIAARVSAIALILLAPWFALNAALFIRTYDDAIAFARGPVHAAGLVLLLGAALFHMMLGMQVIIEDYIGKAGLRAVLLLLNAFAAIGCFFLGAFAVLAINFGPLT